jgi:putative hemolysin
MFLQIAILFLLILLNGVFAMAELALIGARRARLQSEADRGSKGAQSALKLLQESGRFLSTVSIGISLIAVIVSTVGGDSFVEPVAEILSIMPALVPYAHALAIGVVVVVITFCTVVLGELVPKRIAVAHPEKLAMVLARFMTGFAWLVTPIERVLAPDSTLVLKLLPVSSGARLLVSDDEINLMMREGAAAGAFLPAESVIVQMALRLGDRRVDAIMTPRTQVEWVDLEDGWEVNREKIRKLHVSRFPVVEGGPQTVLGILEVKDLLAASLAGETPDIRRLTKPPLYVPNTVPALKLLETLRKTGEAMALIVDEYGDFDGIVTLHDILQALVGDIAEPGEAEDQSAVRRDDGSWLIDGLLPIDDLKDTLGIRHLPEEDSGDFHTLGGFLMARMKRVPKVADHIEVDGWRFEVMDMDGHRVDKVLVVPPELVAARTKG